MEAIKIKVVMPVGMVTGLPDSNGRPILNGDKIRYEYTVGYSLSKDGSKAHYIPFDLTEETFHETVMEYQVREDCAGFFLDKPRQMTFLYACPQTLKYYVVDGD